MLNRPSREAFILPSNTFYKIVLLIVVVFPFLGTLVAVWLLWRHMVYWSDLALFAGMYVIAGFGETVGFHRMLTHRSFQARPVVKFLLLVFGTMAIQGPPIDWAAIHIKHHAQADREGDPHSPLDGFFHAHMGWFFGNIDADPAIYCPHLFKDQVVVFVSRTVWVWSLLSLFIPLLLGGWTGLLWGGLVRMFLSNHAAWSVNSVCHTFGRRNFQTNDRSHNQWVVALLGLGEGWHNNHHAFPRSAFHGLYWWQVDISGYIIWLLERLRLIYNVQRVSPELLVRRLYRQR
jgi:stearoyl-CoA desaturase (Delta-9 desaturase)